MLLPTPERSAAHPLNRPATHRRYTLKSAKPEMYPTSM